MTKQVIYFTAGPAPTGAETTAIGKLNALAAPAYQVTVMNGKEDTKYGYGKQATDYVAGTVPVNYNTVTVINPDAPPSADNLPATQAIVNNAQKITGVTGTGTVANIAVNPTTKAVTVTLTAS